MLQFTDPVVFGLRHVEAGGVAGYQDGESLEVQVRKIAGCATILGLEVERTYVERGVSGSKPLAERSEGAALLAALKPGDVVITPKLDRMFRSALDALTVLGELRKRGVSWHMIDLGGDVTGNGISKLVFTILSAVAEAERDRTRERISEVNADQRKRGRFLGGSVRFGWAGTERGLTPKAAEHAAIARMRALRDEGLSLRAILDRMAAEGVKLSHEAVGHAVRADG